jgi:hypothetical protein
MMVSVAHHSDSPLIIGEVRGAGKPQNLRIATGDEELKLAPTTEHQSAGAPHIEFSLYERNPKLVLAVDRHKGVRNRGWSLSFTDIANGNAGHSVLLGASARNIKRYALGEFRSVGPTEKLLLSIIYRLRRGGRTRVDSSTDAGRRETGVHGIDELFH